MSWSPDIRLNTHSLSHSHGHQRTYAVPHQSSGHAKTKIATHFGRLSANCPRCASACPRVPCPVFMASKMKLNLYTLTHLYACLRTHSAHTHSETRTHEVDSSTCTGCKASGRSGGGETIENRFACWRSARAQQDSASACFFAKTMMVFENLTHTLSRTHSDTLASTRTLETHARHAKSEIRPTHKVHALPGAFNSTLISLWTNAVQRLIPVYPFFFCWEGYGVEVSLAIGARWTHSGSLVQSV